MESHIIFYYDSNKVKFKDLNAIRSWIILTAKREGFSVGELSFVFCTDYYLHTINLAYLNHDTYTDIVSFDYGDEGVIAGEIYISIERVKENSLEYNQEFVRELYRIIIHGVLHLLGYKDKELQQKSQMTSKENYYLSLLPDFDL